MKREILSESVFVAVASDLSFLTGKEHLQDKKTAYDSPVSSRMWSAAPFYLTFVSSHQDIKKAMCQVSCLQSGMASEELVGAKAIQRRGWMQLVAIPDLRARH